MRSTPLLSSLTQDNTVYTFSSDRLELTLQLTDDYTARNEMLSQLLRDSNAWFELALGRAPVELHATLQVISIPRIIILC